MSPQCPDQPTLEKLIALGQCPDGDARIGELLGGLKANACGVSIHPSQDFEWLRDFPWVDACAVIRVVVHLAAARLTKSGGSASAIKNAYRSMEDSDRVAAMELAAWIVDHSENEYTSRPRCARFATPSRGHQKNSRFVVGIPPRLNSGFVRGIVWSIGARVE